MKIYENPAERDEFVKSMSSKPMIIMNNGQSTPARKTALITGIAGQDGAYLAQLLLTKGCQVFGTSRDAGVSRFDSLARMGIAGEATLLSMAPNGFKSTISAIPQARPDEIYHLAGQLDDLNISRDWMGTEYVEAEQNPSREVI